MKDDVQLDKYDNTWYSAGGFLKRVLWYLVNVVFFGLPIPWPAAIKPSLLRMFGACAGKGVVIKPRVNIKYPWFIKIGANVWIGEGVWIDNIADVKIGDNVCISQGAYLCTGNHDWSKQAFDLIAKPILIEDGVWVGAKAIICPGVRLKSYSVITAGSVMTKNAEPYMVYQGNPATAAKQRNIKN
ncbi:MAG: colanic acid biosynthesis acetyltransferase WcaF [Dehalococcoidia bacterium]|nr:MAG: colanic acid biosynthesis acetyltransferase WcaF [Dehalococcoidia bacterium]